MTFPTAIAFNGVKSSPELCASVVGRLQQLETHLGDILACRVDVDATSLHFAGHLRYGVHVRLALPCIEIEAGGKPDAQAAANDPFQTVAGTFDVLTRRIEEYVQRRCRGCRHHAGTAQDRPR